MDNVFSGYVFYPQVDWSKYGYLPPDKCQVLGAWRQPQTKAFAFLLDDSSIKTYGSTISLTLEIAGEISEVLQLEPCINGLKKDLAIQEKKQRANSKDRKRLDYVNKKSVAVLTSITFILAGILNIFSLYLRRIPSPDLGNELVNNIYNGLLTLVHMSALFFLFILILICGVFLIKYGIIFIRRI